MHMLGIVPRVEIWDLILNDAEEVGARLRIPGTTKGTRDGLSGGGLAGSEW